MLGAIVASHALKSRSKAPEKFDVKILTLENTPHLNTREGHQYLRKGKDAIWKNDDLQSFSPLRMMIPQAMNFRGKALVIDPDVFAVADVNELLEIQMNGNSILCRHVKDGYQSNGNSFYATSVMLLDCEKLNHWEWDKQINLMFLKILDYGDWISLKLEDSKNIGQLPEEWNHFDILNDHTKFLHNTERSTQPWKTGLPVDFNTTTKNFNSNFLSLFRPIKRYLPHPDPKQEKFVLTLIKECLENGLIDEKFLVREISQRHIRVDIFEKINKI